jgi:hypothetical protein
LQTGTTKKKHVLWKSDGEFFSSEKVVSEIFFPCCEERWKKKKQTGLRMTTDEDFVFLNFTGCEWKTKFVLLSVYIRRKKNSKPFSF